MLVQDQLVWSDVLKQIGTKTLFIHGFFQVFFFFFFWIILVGCSSNIFQNYLEKKLK